MSTSCDQKMKDGACENISCITNTTSAINTVSNDINNMSISNNNITSTDAADSISVCANCGKEGTNINNVCNKCKMVRYCNAACKKKHRHKHKKDCEEHLRLAAEKRNEELRLAAEKHDEELFKQPPSNEDCPICFLRIPTLDTGSKYQSCCGKEICSGCLYAVGKIDKEEKCPFCRTPIHTSEEELNKRREKCVEAGDTHAMYNLGCHYREGTPGLPQDYTKALELFHRAAKLGSTEAHCSIGYFYNNGQGVEVDMKKARHYYELAAMGGNEMARANLGLMEAEAGNMDRALKHYMIAVKGGFALSLEEIQDLYSNGYATKEDYKKALQSYQEYLDEIKSRQRDEAAAAHERFRYHGRYY